MPYRDFAHEAAERARVVEPIVFTMPGAEGDLLAVSSVPAGVLADLLAAPDPPAVDAAEAENLTPERIAELQAKALESHNALCRFFRQVVVPECHAELDKALTASDGPTLQAAMQWLLEELSGRPTKPSSGSPNGPTADGNSLTLPVAEREPEPSPT